MLHDWGVIAAAFGYIGFLFLVASHGDRLSPTQRGRASALIYPLSLAIYCTSWTFFGSVGNGERNDGQQARSDREPHDTSESGGTILGVRLSRARILEQNPSAIR